MFPIHIGFFAAGGATGVKTYAEIVREDNPFMYLRMHDYNDPKYIIDSSATEIVNKIDVTTTQPTWRVAGPLAAELSYGVQFPVNNSYFVINDATELSNFLSNTDQGTLETWWKPYNLTESSYIFEITDTTSSNHLILLYWDWGTDKLKIIYRTSATAGTTNWVVGTTNSISAATDTWMHVAFVSHDTGTPSIYLNGKLQAVTVESGTPSGQWFGDLTSANRLYINAHVFSGSTNYRHGTISEMAIYNYKLDKQRIGYHYFKGINALSNLDNNEYMLHAMGGHPKLLNTLDVPSSYGTGLYESIMNPYDNDSGTYGVQTFSGTEYEAYGVPNIFKDKATYFNTTSDGSIRTDTTTTAMLDDISAGSIEVWVRFDTENAYIFMMSDASSTDDYLYLSLNTSGFATGFRNSTGTWGANYWQQQFYFGEMVKDRTDWHHIVLTSGSGSTWDLWLNGIKLTQTGSQGTPNNKWFSDLAAGQDYLMLSRFYRSGTDNKYAGEWSNLSVYDYVLSETQIKNLYYSGYYNKHPYLSLAHNLGPSNIFDLSKDSVIDRNVDNYVTMTTIGTPTSGVEDPLGFKGATTFDGSSNYLTTTDPGTGNMNLTGAHTLLCWVKTSADETTDLGIMGQFYDDGGSFIDDKCSVMALHGTDENLRYFFSSDGDAHTGLDSNETLKTGEWIMVAATYSPSTRVAVFMNGKLKNISTTSIPASLYDSAGHFEIANFFDSARHFNGSIAYPVVYEKELTGTELGILYYFSQHTSNSNTAYVSKQLEDGATIIIPLQDPTGSSQVIMAAPHDVPNINPAANVNGSTVCNATGSPLGTSVWMPGTDTAAHNIGLDSIDTYMDNFTEGSLEIWFRCNPENENSNAVLCSLSRGTGSSYHASWWVSPGNSGRVEINIFTTATQIQAYTTDKHYADGRWHHAVFTVETGVGNSMYIDGVKKTLTYLTGSSSTTTFLSSQSPATSFRLGHRYYTGEPTNDAKFRGELCGFAAYTSPLTDAQVLDHYLTGKNNRPNYVNYVETILEDQPVCYLRLNSSSTGTERDLVNDFVFTVGAGVTERQTSLLAAADMKIHEDNYCMDFTGASTTNNVTGPTSESTLQLTGTLSISMWIAADDYTPTANEVIFDCQGSDTETEADNVLYRATLTTDGTVDVIWEYGAGSNEINSSTEVLHTTDGEAIHFGYVRNSAENKVYLYKNGVLLESFSFTNEATGGTNAELHLGQTAQGTAMFNGKIQEFALYDKDIGADGMLKHYKAGKGIL